MVSVKKVTDRNENDGLSIVQKSQVRALLFARTLSGRESEYKPRGQLSTKPTIQKASVRGAPEVPNRTGSMQTNWDYYYWNETKVNDDGESLEACAR